MTGKIYKLVEKEVVSKYDNRYNIINSPDKLFVNSEVVIVC